MKKRSQTSNLRAWVYNSSKVTWRFDNMILQKQPLRGVLKKRCSENMQENNFIEITLRHGCSPVNFLHIFRTPFLKNTSEWLHLILKKFLQALGIWKGITNSLWIKHATFQLMNHSLVKFCSTKLLLAWRTIVGIPPSYLGDESFQKLKGKGGHQDFWLTLGCRKSWGTV